MRKKNSELKAFVVLVALLHAAGVAALEGCATGGGGQDDPGATTAAGGNGDNDDPGGIDPGGIDPGNTTGGQPTEDCGRVEFSVERKPVDILLVLDRSASMKDDPSGGDGSPSKWEIVVPALQEVIKSTDDGVSWGLKVFPLGDGEGACTAASFPEDILVPIAEKNASKVNAAISATSDEGDGTPTGDAINKAVEYLKGIQNDNVKYLVLATDGDPSCPKEDADEFAVEAVSAAAAAGYHTFVVGVASSASKVKALNEVAIAGLEPRVDPDPLAPKFYIAATKDQLVTAMQTITGNAASCLFPLSEPPPNPDHVGVFIGDQQVEQDTTGTEGWNYTGPDMKGIELHGAACETVKNGGAELVGVIFGCKDDPLY
ncbi:vWA domain-containing protein [Polyangium aurulentum]|uniref:vWA domain-containing protein n=1 Tax=Polyangium aurulentum TaxID=2567896 RepID=UPI0010AE4476|nr:vWA domain-containing protein [Polyangium aurulentum]UQA59860.1 VWA domain-containing protein [Polyangium aurulentum]